MRIPILTYHAVNISGNEYATNDHVAFAADLRLIHALGLRIVPLHHVVANLLGRTNDDLSGCVALTCDDGTDLDYRDLDWPGHGMQRSLFNCLRDFQSEFDESAQPGLHLTAFVIASREARAHMDRECLFDLGWMNDGWWRTAIESGLIAIENHSWDHNHAAIPLPGIGGMTRGSFHDVNNIARADAEIIAAARAIDAHIAPTRTTLFCYPFGHVPEYLQRDYFPNRMAEHGMDAAFGDAGAALTEHTDRWNIPRYVCGWHWKSLDELRAILLESANADSAGSRTA